MEYKIPLSMQYHISQAINLAPIHLEHIKEHLDGFMQK